MARGEQKSKNTCAQSRCALSLELWGTSAAGFEEHQRCAKHYAPTNKLIPLANERRSGASFDQLRSQQHEKHYLLFINRSNRTIMAIYTFRDSYLEEFYEDDIVGKKIPANLDGQLYRAIQKIDAAHKLKDLRSPPGNRLKALDGNLKGKYAIRVNQQYRLIFEWNEQTGEAVDLYLDPHKYK